MKKVFAFLLYTIFFLAMVIYFTPKVNLYYEAEIALKKFNIIISDENIKDKGFSLAIERADIYAMDGIKVANIDAFELKVLGVYNRVHIEGVTLTSAAASFVPTKINRIDMQYSVLNPLNVTAFALGDFGEANAIVNLKERHLRVTLLPSKLMFSRFKNTIKMLKKSDEGTYVYEYDF